MKSDVIQNILKSRISTLQHHIFDVVGGFVVNDLRRYTNLHEITTKFTVKDSVSMKDVKVQDGLAYIAYNESKSVMMVLNYNFINSMFRHAFEDVSLEEKKDDTIPKNEIEKSDKNTIKKEKKSDKKTDKKENLEEKEGANKLQKQGCTDIESYIARVFSGRIFESIKNSLLYKYNYVFDPKIVNYKSMNTYLISLMYGTLWEVKFEGGAFDENAILRIFLSNEFAGEILMNEYTATESETKSGIEDSVNISDKTDIIMLQVVFGMHLQSMKLKDVPNIAVGQKFAVGGDVTESVAMNINNKIFARGSLGEVDNDRALKINFIDKV